MTPPVTAAYRIDGRSVSATDFYAAACDPRRSVAVEACAGAGKTWMLVSRILRALLDGAEPSQILAITFTRKATGEMRQRLDEWLQLFAAPAADEATRIQALVDRGLSAAQAKTLAPQLGGLHARVLDDVRRVEIRTFHGWFGQLLAQAPIETLLAMGLAPGLQLIEDPESLRDELMGAFHRAVQADPARRDDYVALVRKYRRHTVQSWLDAAWQRRTEVEAADRAGTLATSVPPAADVFADCRAGEHPVAAILAPAMRALLQALASALGVRTPITSQRAAQALVDALADPDAHSAFARAWTALFTQAGTPRKQLGDLPEQHAASEALIALQGRAGQQDAHDDHARMTRLARVLLAEYAQLKRTRALADMGDLEAVALALLSDGDLAAWVQSRLDLRLRHLLIDEFQDTSPLQWQALHGWLSGYAGAGGGRPMSVFIVGDPKQSIYRFRRAEPRVFAAAQAFVAEALQGQVLACDHTRRNAPAIVDGLNAVFTDAAEADGWTGFRPHTTASQAVGEIRRLPVVPLEPVARGQGADADPGWRDALTVPRSAEETVRREPEVRQVAAAIGELLAQGVPPGELMVLARKRDTLARVARALAARHLPYTVPEALSLAESPEAQDLIALLDVLASPGHDLSLARALRSPIFGATDADLLALSRAAAAAGSWWAALAAGGDACASSPALQRARGLLAGWAEAAAALPPHDLLDRIVHEGEVHARLAAALPPRLRRSALQAVDALLAASLDVGGGRYATPYRFVRALRRDDVMSRLPAPPDAVRLLTVHGAKGLEARWVFVVDADPQARRAERATLLIDWPAEQRAPRTVAFVAREGAVAPSLQALLEEEREARGREEINGLYVAMTRAEVGLVFSSTPPRAPDPRSWWARVQGRAVEWTPQESPVASIAVERVHVPALPEWEQRLPLADRSARPASAERAASARLGQAVHRLLEWIGQPGAPMDRADWPAAAEAAAAQFDAGPQSSQVLALAREIVDSPECKRFFTGAALRWAANEVPLSHQGELLRLDRLVRLDEGAGPVWWVLDYKLGDTPEAVAVYRAQMARYVVAVQAAQPGEAVQGAFITGRGRVVGSG